MKKIILLFGGILISSMLGMTVSVVSAGTADELMEEVFSAAGFNKSFKNEADEMGKLSKQGDAFQNLHLFVYQNVKDGPKEAALEEVARRTSFEKDELKEILIEGNIQLIEEKKREAVEDRADEIAEDHEEEEGDATFEEYLQETYNYEYDPIEGEFGDILTQEYVIYLYAKLKDLYEEEFEFQSTNKKLALEAFASEMFMNGDKNDSAGIDLLADLDMINEILFGAPIVYPDRDDDSVSLASIPEEEVVVVEEKEEEVFLAEEEEDNLYACFEDEDLRAALDAYGEDGGVTGGGAIAGGPSLGGGDDGGDGGDGGSGDDEDNSVQDEIDDILDAIAVESGNWARPGLPCNEIFCITVNLVTEDNSPEVDGSSPTANYIASHVAYINKRMEETLSKNMSPSKVSANWFEDATCKKAGFLASLDLHVYGVPQPITLDPADDTDEKANERAENLNDKLEAAESRYGTTTPAEADCKSILNMAAYVDAGTSLEDAMVSCESASETVQANVDAAIADYIFQSQADASNTFYEQVSAEIYAFKQYFESFQRALKKTYEEDSAPLSALMSKAFCK
jgi:hypothetical protein